jgi:shikimate dehydrogenase
MPERLAVIGDPIAHSLSPAMQGAALLVAGLPWTYEAVWVPAHRLAEQILQFREEGYRGFNVTIPHKRDVLALMDQVTPDAAAVDAVNTVVLDRGRLLGYNTDVAGFLAALRTLAGDIAGRLVVVFGAGGAARAAVRALLRSRASVSVVSRDVNRARLLVPAEDAFASSDPLVLPRIQNADVLVNATPLGMKHLAGESPLSVSARLRPGAVVMDMVYGRCTPFLEQARSQGCIAGDGLEMLVQQGAESFRLWTGIDPDLNVMRAACGMEIGEVHQC